jgi:hypothetical protein
MFDKGETMEDNTKNKQHLDLDDEQLQDATGGAWLGRGQRAQAESVIGIHQKNARFAGRRGNNQALADQLEAINKLNDKIKGF